MNNPSKQQICYVTLLVRDYDEAIEYFTNKLRFNLIEDKKLSEDKRWVLVAPPHSVGTQILLAKAVNEKQKKAIGNQAGGRVFMFLQTEDFSRDYARFKNSRVKFTEEPRTEEYGTVVVFEDLYGNRWDLLQLNN